jgi:hypothetical protein
MLNRTRRTVDHIPRSFEILIGKGHFSEILEKTFDHWIVPSQKLRIHTPDQTQSREQLFRIIEKPSTIFSEIAPFWLLPRTLLRSWMVFRWSQFGTKLLRSPQKCLRNSKPFKEWIEEKVLQSPQNGFRKRQESLNDCEYIHMLISMKTPISSNT